VPSLVAVCNVESQGGHRWTVKPDSDAVVVFQFTELEILETRPNRSCVTKQSHVQGVAVGNPSPFTRHQEAVFIAESPRAIAAQR